MNPNEPFDKEPEVRVFYEKFYIDSKSKHIPSLFETNPVETMSIHRYWQNSVDAFMMYPYITYVTCINGDIRVIIAYEVDNGYKFNQYFASEMDGKVIKVPANTWFGLHNISCGYSTIIQGFTKQKSTPKRLSNNIFNWYDN